MNYTHEKKNGLARLIYMALFVVGCILACLELKGYYRVLFTTLGMAMVMIAIILFIRYESTTYSIVINPNKTDFDFFINKAVGRRGAYACYFYVSDTVEIVKYETGTKDELRRKYQGVEFYYYVHNIKSNDRYAIIFKYNDGMCAAVVCEMNAEALAYYNDCRSKAVHFDKSEDLEANEDVGLGEEAILEVKLENSNSQGEEPQESIKEEADNN